MPQRRYRKRKSCDSDEEDERTPHLNEKEKEEEADVRQKLAEAKEIQKFRKRPAGVSAVGLAFGEKFTEEEKLAPDPFKLKTGGLVEMKEVNPSDLEESEDDLLQRLKSTFSAETKLKDDETHMMQYIEQEMIKQKGKKEDDVKLSTYETKIKALYQLPDRLNFKSNSNKTEAMLSNQMLSGIPEVDLGLEVKFKNIEETEKAKHNFIEEQATKKKEKQSLVPTNMATNFTLHSLRFYKDKNKHGHTSKSKQESSESSKPETTSYIPVVGENEPELKLANAADTHKRKLDQRQLATDDYYYDKYRKKTRHY